LDWDRERLSQESGVSLQQIASFETGRTESPRQRTLMDLERAFLRNRIGFKDGGVQPKCVSSYILDSYMEVLEDIILSLPDGGEVLKHCVDDSRSTPQVIEKVREMRRAGISERITISDKNNIITGMPEDYRQIPDAYFASSEVVIIYLDKVVFFDEGKMLIILSQNLACVFKDQFEYWWKQGRKINVS